MHAHFDSADGIGHGTGRLGEQRVADRRVRAFLTAISDDVPDVAPVN